MNDILHTYAQVERIYQTFRVINLPQFSEISQLEHDIFNDYSDIKKITSPIQEINPGTDTVSVNDQLSSLTEEKKSYKRILTSTIIQASIQLFKGNKAVRVDCYPFVDNILSVPKKGDWVHVVGIKVDLLNMAEIKGFENEYIYYYIPTQLFKKLNAGISPSYSDKEEKELGAKAKNILGQRGGSSLIQNNNGKSYVQVDNNEVLLSTGFSDFNIKNDDIKSSSYFDFLRYNPISQNDSVFFLSSYDKEGEQKIYDYYKNLYELNDYNKKIADEAINKIKNLKNFEDRIRLFFGTDFSIKPEYEYAEKNNNDDTELTKDNGTLIHSKKIYLSTSGQGKKQTKYTAARSERVIDLLSGIIDFTKELHGSVVKLGDAVKQIDTTLSTHSHLYVPSTQVLTPDPSTISNLTKANVSIATVSNEINQLTSKLDELKSKLNSISTKNIFIP